MAPYLIVVIFMLLVMFGTTLFVFSRYKRVPPGQIMAVFGRTNDPSGLQIYDGGGAMILPIIQGHAFIDKGPYEVALELVSDSNRTLPISGQVGIGKSPDAMREAANYLMGLSESEVCRLATDIFQGNLSVLMGDTSAEQLASNPGAMKDLLVAAAAPDLALVGLEIVNLRVDATIDASGETWTVNRTTTLR